MLNLGNLPRRSESEYGQPRPVLFLHIPKTAGTSFLLMLKNTFGDNRVCRLHNVDANVQQTIDELIDVELDNISCLAGHMPIHLFKEHFDKFQVFTVLREPAARVLSLYRFLRLGRSSEVARLGLRPNFSLTEFLMSAHPEIYGQINNGMVRMLCGDPNFTDPDSRDFWEIESKPDALRNAMNNLKRLDFGLTEDMPRTLREARSCWAIPYELEQYRENTTPQDPTEDITDLARIITLNTMDLALYHKACEMFRDRTGPEPPFVLEHSANPRSIFEPPIDHDVSIADVAGRQGFYEFEPAAGRISWLRTDQPVGMHLRAHGNRLRLSLHVYTVVPDYPLSDIDITVNGDRVEHTSDVINDHWARLKTEAFETSDGITRVAIRLPLAIAATELDPTSKDRRRLGVAIADLKVTLAH